MRCPACGAFYRERSPRCPECGAIQQDSSADFFPEAQPEIVKETISVKTAEKKRAKTSQAPSLIEFPGVNRSALPHWRKELGDRVREVQERRARESILEAGLTEPPISQSGLATGPMLELLPQAEVPPPNPLVVAALRRIERAYSQPAINTAVATAVLCDEQTEIELDLTPTPTATKTERTHNLAVVPTPPTMTNDILQEPRKPIRVISDHDDPALNYLDSVPRSITLETREYRSAPIYLRMLAGLVDILFVCLLASPFMALVRLTNLEWRSPSVIGFALGTFLVVGFLYQTICVAFTGRSIGTKLFYMRVVDTRTGLIPTGSQSVGRAFLYMLTLAAAGIALMYTFIDREKYTAHDRFTGTAVIRA